MVGLAPGPALGIDGLVEAGPSRIRVLIRHELPLVAEVLGLALGADPDLQVLSTRADLTDADVVLLSAEPDALSVIAAICAERPGRKVIVLATAFDDTAFFASASAGAIGYLTGETRLDDLVSAVKRAHAGEVLYAAEHLYALLRRRRTPEQGLPPSAGLTRPAKRELEVLQALALGASTDEVAAQLCISVHTVRTHVKNAMTKLEARSKLEAVVVALRAGFIELQPASEAREPIS